MDDGNHRWDLEWKEISRRLLFWNTAAETYLRYSNHVAGTPAAKALNKVIISDSDSMISSIDSLRLPDHLREAIAQVKNGLATALNVKEGDRAVAIRCVAIAALRSPLDEALSRLEEAQRRMVEKSFLHLSRLLSMDADIRRKWAIAFRKSEPQCEKLGALHLLSHGIYPFKIDAFSGRTDLMLHEGKRVDIFTQKPLAVTDEISSVDALVLTEWKKVNENNFAAKAREARKQASRYSRTEMTGLEVRRHRYIVLVSRKPIALLPSDSDHAVTYHYINIAIDPSAPSVEARTAPTGS